MHALSLLLSVFDWRSRAVLGRNFKVFLRNWKTAMLPPAMEPVVYFVAFGIGLATYVGGVPHEGRMVDYGSWVAPGMMAYTAFATPYYEALYSAYVRMFYQKTWDGILATQVEIRHLVWGEILWAGLRGVCNTLVVGIDAVVWNNGGLYHHLHRPTPGQRILLDPVEGPRFAAQIEESAFVEAIRGTWGARRMASSARACRALSRKARR